MLTERPIAAYDDAQLREYLDYIGFWREGDLSNGASTTTVAKIPACGLATLRRVMQRHQCTIPFSSTLVQFESSTLTIDQEALFQRLAKHKGSFYCFGQNVLLAGMLKAMGFDIYGGIARSNFASVSDPTYQPGPITHIVLFTTLQGEDGTGTWLVDVGYGGVNIIQPLRIPTSPDVREQTYSGVGPENYRIVPLKLASNGVNTRPSLARFALEHQTGKPFYAEDSLKNEGVPNGTGFEWKVQYSFNMEEYFLNDYNILHWGTCAAPDGPQAFRIVASKLEEVKPEANDSDRDKYGRIILLNNQVKRRHAGKTTPIAKLENEKDRLVALAQYFNIVIPEGETVIRNKSRYLG